jgi:hypothetical protein
VFAVVSEGRVYRPSTFGPALTSPAGTDGARGRACRGGASVYRDVRAVYAREEPHSTDFSL